MTQIGLGQGPSTVMTWVTRAMFYGGVNDTVRAIVNDTVRAIVHFAFMPQVAVGMNIKLQARQVWGSGVTQVEFPEVRGALLKFLQVLSPLWNISLFHYRQSGNRSSTILLGLQVPPHPARARPRMCFLSTIRTQVPVGRIMRSYALPCKQLLSPSYTRVHMKPDVICCGCLYRVCLTNDPARLWL